MADFLPCAKAYDALNVAKIFFEEILCLHGLSKTVVLDRDVKFMSYLWQMWKSAAYRT